MSFEPRITTVIPTYRRPLLLRRAVLSVLKQSHPHFIVHILDNASGDDTEQVARELMRTRSPGFLPSSSREHRRPAQHHSRHRACHDAIFQRAQRRRHVDAGLLRARAASSRAGEGAPGVRVDARGGGQRTRSLHRTMDFSPGGMPVIAAGRGDQLSQGRRVDTGHHLSNRCHSTHRRAEGRVVELDRVRMARAGRHQLRHRVLVGDGGDCLRSRGQPFKAYGHQRVSNQLVQDAGGGPRRGDEGCHERSMVEPGRSAARVQEIRRHGDAPVHG